MFFFFSSFSFFYDDVANVKNAISRFYCKIKNALVKDVNCTVSRSDSLEMEMSL